MQFFVENLSALGPALLEHFYYQKLEEAGLVLKYVVKANIHCQQAKAENL